MQKIIKPIHAREGEFVDIHWHCSEGIHVERLACPPLSTREARASREDVDRDQVEALGGEVDEPTKTTD